MELRQLRYFVAIAEAGSVSRASDRLRVAQPALSMQLANLEAEFGTRLFERTNRGMMLTASGALLLRHAESILKHVTDATQAIRSSHDITGEVSLGFPTTVSNAFVVELLRRASIDLPGVRLRIAEHMTAFLGRLIADGGLDLAILMNAPDQASLALQPLLLENYCLISPPGTKGEAQIAWRDSVDLPFVLPSSASNLRIMLEEAALQSGTIIQVAAELDSARLLLAAVRAGVGHSILPRSSLVDRSLVEGLLIRPIVSPEIRSLLQLASSAIRTSIPAQLAVRDLIVRVVRDLVLDGSWRAELHTSLA